MGLFDSKSSIIGAALGASIGSGQKWTMADSLRLVLLMQEKKIHQVIMCIVAVVIAVMTMVLRIKAVAIVVVTVVLIMSTTI